MIERVNSKEQLNTCLEIINKSFITVADEFGLTEENCPNHTAFMPIDKLIRQIKTDKSKLKKAKKRIVQLEKVLNKLYEDRAQDKITEERYLAMNGQYETEYNELKAQAQALHERITATETATMNAQIFSDLIEKYADLQELNARILNELIERIVIHEKEIINGEKFQTVEIYYKFVGVI